MPGRSPSGVRILGVALALGALAPAGCASKTPRLVQPDSIEAFCADKSARGPRVVSILSSVADRIEPVDVPPEAALREHIADDGGVIGRWKSQPLYMPGTARALGVGGDYVDVREVAVADDVGRSDSRIIYVTVDTPAGEKRLALQAFDTQSVCLSSGE